MAKMLSSHGLGEKAVKVLHETASIYGVAIYETDGGWLRVACVTCSIGGYELHWSNSNKNWYCSNCEKVWAKPGEGVGSSTYRIGTSLSYLTHTVAEWVALWIGEPVENIFVSEDPS